jgi:hypothetical protein
VFAIKIMIMNYSISIDTVYNLILTTVFAIFSQVAQPPSQLQQASAHQTFYPWMAIAGKNIGPSNAMQLPRIGRLQL